MGTTEENNRMIAEFMGVKFTKIGERFMASPTPNEIGSCWEELLKYHTSWDWLMPVVKKIRGIEEGMLVERIDFMPNDGICIYIEGREQIIVDADGVIDGDRIATYQAVVKFIEWYNEQQKS